MILFSSETRNALKGESNRSKQATDRWVVADIKRSIRCLEAAIARCEAEIDKVIAKHETLATTSCRLQTAPGVGPIVATTLLAEMPELGGISPKAIAALAGLAPFARDSGQRTPARSIRGGRPVPRKLLYLAALSATRHNPTFKTFRDRLEVHGKTPKQAIIAAARKLLTVLNAMIRDEKDFEMVNI